MLSSIQKWLSGHTEDTEDYASDLDDSNDSNDSEENAKKPRVTSAEGGVSPIWTLAKIAVGVLAVTAAGYGASSGPMGSSVAPQTGGGLSSNVTMYGGGYQFPLASGTPAGYLAAHGNFSTRHFGPEVFDVSAPSLIPHPAALQFGTSMPWAFDADESVAHLPLSAVPIAADDLPLDLAGGAEVDGAEIAGNDTAVQSGSAPDAVPPLGMAQVDAVVDSGVANTHMVATGAEPVFVDVHAQVSQVARTSTDMTTLPGKDAQAPANVTIKIDPPVRAIDGSVVDSSVANTHLAATGAEPVRVDIRPQVSQVARTSTGLTVPVSEDAQALQTPANVTFKIIPPVRAIPGTASGVAKALPGTSPLFNSVAGGKKRVSTNVGPRAAHKHTPADFRKALNLTNTSGSLDEVLGEGADRVSMPLPTEDGRAPGYVISGGSSFLRELDRRHHSTTSPLKLDAAADASVATGNQSLWLVGAILAALAASRTNVVRATGGMALNGVNTVGEGALSIVRTTSAMPSTMARGFMGLLSSAKEAMPGPRGAALAVVGAAVLLAVATGYAPALASAAGGMLSHVPGVATAATAVMGAAFEHPIAVGVGVTVAIGATAFAYQKWIRGMKRPPLLLTDGSAAATLKFDTLTTDQLQRILTGYQVAVSGDGINKQITLTKEADKKVFTFKAQQQGNGYSLPVSFTNEQLQDTSAPSDELMAMIQIAAAGSPSGRSIVISTAEEGVFKKLCAAAVAVAKDSSTELTVELSDPQQIHWFMDSKLSGVKALLPGSDKYVIELQTDGNYKLTANGKDVKDKEISVPGIKLTKVSDGIYSAAVLATSARVLRMPTATKPDASTSAGGPVI
jgi:hypothetical protein